MSKKALLLFFFISFLLKSYGQKLLEKQPSDSTLNIYNQIHTFSNKNEFSRFFYKYIFQSPKKDDVKSDVKKEVNQNYNLYEGKIIRKIYVLNEGPFCINSNDSVFFSQKTLNKIGNSLHINTQSITIKNLLLFKEKDRFDSISVKESERLIRKQRYIEEGLIDGLIVENSPDSIDIVVRVKDEFSFMPEGQISSSKFSLGVKEKNFLGLGQTLHSYYSWNTSGKTNNYQYDYSVPNILNSYIKTDILYRKNVIDTTETGIFSIERPFYSALSKWGGGISISMESQKYLINIPNTPSFVLQNFEYGIQDYWAAYSLKIKRDILKTEKLTNLILSARYFSLNYEESPFPEYDPENFYADENMFFLGLGLSERYYMKDKYLFKYGFVEDIPTGKSFDLVFGYQRKNDRNRPYLGSKISFGQYTKAGYIGTTVEYGSFFNNFKIEEGVFTTEINYFTPLAKIGNFKFRQFVKPQLLLGINRSKSDYLSLNDYFGINGFNSDELIGSKKMLCSFQSQVYCPWNVWGFKFGPYFVYSLGMIGNNDESFSKSKIYSLFGLGFLIRNDYLIFNSIQISFSFYPSIPGNSENVFKFNTYSTSDFGLPDFQTEKPQKIRYK